MYQSCGDPDAGAADWVAQGDGAPVNVESIGIKTKVAIARNHLRSKSFVKFDQFDLAQPKPLAASRERTAGTGPIPMISGATPVTS